MPIVSIVCGALLVLISVWSNSATVPDPDTGAKSFTLWIPALVGGLLVVCGVLGLKESRLKHAMHAAAMIGLLGGLAAAWRFVPKLLAGPDWSDPRPVATGTMTLVCLR
ncbi:MAG: hypothetical protein U0797_04180 [Gemmataceae bacterium]